MAYKVPGTKCDPSLETCSAQGRCTFELKAAAAEAGLPLRNFSISYPSHRRIRKAAKRYDTGMPAIGNFERSIYKMFRDFEAEFRAEFIDKPILCG
jgi:hypothetical protein